MALTDSWRGGQWPAAGSTAAARPRCVTEAKGWVQEEKEQWRKGKRGMVGLMPTERDLKNVGGGIHEV